MSCKAPLLRFYNPRDSNETQRIVSLGQAMTEHPEITGYEDIAKRQDVMLIPCGKCIGCRIRMRQDWATRMELEARDYPDSTWFVTLTYAPETVPTMHLETGELVQGGVTIWADEAERPEAVNVLNMDDMTKFWKRLRRIQEQHQDMGTDIRYFYCGEYGERTGRPHYHAIIYGLKLPDAKKVKGQNPYYSSKILEKIWGLGQVTIAQAEPATYNYVSGYVTKKMYGNDTKEYTKLGLPTPYACMSRNPGIGIPWLEQNINKLWEQDYIQLAGKQAPIPRAFDKVMESVDPVKLWERKHQRQRQAINGVIQQQELTGQSLAEVWETKDRVLKKRFRQRTGVL